MRYYPTSDEKFYVDLKTYTSECHLDKNKVRPLKPKIYPKYKNEVSYIPYWRDIYAPKGTLLDHELCFDKWRMTRTIRCACLPVAGQVKRIKLMQRFPAGFLRPPRILNLQEVREAQGTLAGGSRLSTSSGSMKEDDEEGSKKGGKGKKGKNGKK